MMLSLRGAGQGGAARGAERTRNETTEGGDFEYAGYSASVFGTYRNEARRLAEWSGERRERYSRRAAGAWRGRKSAETTWHGSISFTMCTCTGFLCE